MLTRQPINVQYHNQVLGPIRKDFKVYIKLKV